MRMLKTLIIDDEELIVEGLMYSIDWESLGYQIVGSAINGEEAIKLIESTVPDLIITDIRMPFVDGLELIEFIKPKFPNTYIIIISGHDEFQYARKAIQLGVYDFLLKPFDLNYLKKILTKLRCEIAINSMKNQKINFEELYMLQNKLFEDILYKRIDKSQLQKKIKDYGLPDLYKVYVSLISIQIDQYKSIAEETIERVMEIYNNINTHIGLVINGEKLTYSFEGSTGNFIIIIIRKKSVILDTVTKMIAKKIKQQIDTNTNISITIGCSSVQFGIDNIFKCYKEALEASNERFIYGYNQIFYYENCSKQNLEGSNFPQINYNSGEFVNYLQKNNEEQIIKYIDDVFNNITKNGSNSSLFVTMLMTSIYVETINFLNSRDITIEDVFKNPIDIYHSLINPQNVYEIKTNLINFSKKVLKSISQKLSITSNSQIELAKEYINNNYYNPDMTLQIVAEHVQMGVCYFSSMFKKQTNESFINYLTRIRIEKAKELLINTNKKTYEIAYMVGYNNSTYFSTIFKKSEGVSPTQYRTQYAYK